MATTSTQMIFDSYVSNTNVNQWISAFVNSMVSVTGWLQTADTGQTSLGNFATQGNVSDTAYGYQIYTFTDSLTATYPLFVKFEFGAGGNNNGSTPGIWITVGTSTNGSGTLTGQVSQRLETSSANNNNSSYFTSYFSGASNRFVCALYDSMNVTLIISVERSKDSSGNDNGDGAIIYTASNRSGCYQTFMPTTGTVVTALPFWQGAFQFNQSMAVNNLVGITFPTPFNAVPYNSGYNLAVSNGTDIPMYNQVIGTIYGNSHNYLQLQYNTYIPLIPQIRMDSVPGSAAAPFSNNPVYAVPLRPMIRYD